MISIICAYNNEKILSKMIDSLNCQKNVEHELILIDAKQNGYCSAAETLNYGGRKAQGEYLIFVHQDIVFTSNNTLYELEKFCREEIFGIAGIAGARIKNSKLETVSKIVHGDEMKFAAEIKDFDHCLDVITLDECMLIIPKEIFDFYKFSDLGPTWHLYGADYCTKMQLSGKRIVVFPIELWHMSDGKSLNCNYFDSIKKLVNIFPGQKKIYTMFGWWPSNSILLFFKILYRKILFLIERRSL